MIADSQVEVAWWGEEDPTAADSLRPKSLAEFHGQPSVSRELTIILHSAKARKAMSDHLLFTGPPGLGKTTLAGIVAEELGLSMVTTTGPSIEKPGDLAGILTSLRSHSLLFIDEIHSLPKVCEEILYTAMEDRRLDVTMGEGPGARIISVPLERFVVVGATTQAGRISAPLRDRFGYSARLRLYDTTALAAIVRRTGLLLGLDEESLSEDAAMMIASRSRGTPRVANAWLRLVRDFALTTKCTAIDEKVAVDALAAFGVDELGLDELGRDILRALCEIYQGGPVGVSALAATVGEATSTLEEVYEPYLISQKLYARTPRGRIALAKAFEHLNLVVPARLRGEELEPLARTLDFNQ